MAKQLFITLSKQEKVEEDKVSDRDIELKILSQSLEFAASNEKGWKEINCIRDCLEQIESLTDESEGLSLTKDDLDRFKGGYDKIVALKNPMGGSGVPVAWIRQGGRLYAQLESPQEPAEATQDSE